MEITSILAYLSYAKSGQDAIEVINKTKIFPFFLKAFKGIVDQKKLNEELKNYFDLQAKNNSYLNTIVFQNKPKFIQDIYVPLTLQKMDSQKENFKLDEKLDVNTILSYNKILVVDYAGMGKSTCTKWLYLSCLSSPEYMPFLIELRNLSKKKGIEDLIQEDLNLKHNLFNTEITNELLSSNKVVFFLDGLDEIEGENRKDILAQINKFHMKYSQAIYIMTSRPEDFLVGIKGFIHFKLKKFNKHEAFSLIKKYDTENKYADKIINDIEKTHNELVIEEFLGNPLSVSLLFTSYCYTPQISFNKIQFYHNIFEALYERHDFSKGDGFFRPRHCTLNKNDFLKILCHLGMETCLKLKKVSFSYSELCEVIGNAKKFFALDFDMDQYIKDLKSTVPLIVEDGSNLKWSHKTFQDYYAACFLRYHYEKKFDVLSKISKRSEYYNVLDFYYELDENGCKKQLLKEELKKIIDYRDKINKKAKNINLANNLANIFIDRNPIQYYCTKTQLFTSKNDFRKVFEHFQLLREQSSAELIQETMAALYQLGKDGKIMIMYHANHSFHASFPIIVRLAIRKNPKLQKEPVTCIKFEDLIIVEEDKLVTLDVSSFVGSNVEFITLSNYIVNRSTSLDFSEIEKEYANIIEIEKNENEYDIKL